MRFDNRIMSEVGSRVAKLWLEGKLINNVYIPPQLRVKTGFLGSHSGRIFEFNPWGSSATRFFKKFVQNGCTWDSPHIIIFSPPWFMSWGVNVPSCPMSEYVAGSGS